MVSVFLINGVTVQNCKSVTSFVPTGYVCGIMSDVGTFVYVLVFCQHEPFVQKLHCSPVCIIQVFPSAFFAILHLLVVLITYCRYKYVAYRT
jgi:hypothetical protein